MTKQDRRVRRTQNLLGDALVSLILEKGYEAVTIKDVTERADVAYVTFFRHYSDIDELLKQRLDTIVEAVIERLEKATHIDVALADATLQSLREEAAREGALIFEHAQEQQTLYRILLGSPGAVHVVKHLKRKIAAHINFECQQTLGDRIVPVPVEILANHAAGAILNLVEWWLENDRPYSVEAMGEFYSRLIVEAVFDRLMETA